jgi:uroporphyrinogen decarboxylase
VLDVEYTSHERVKAALEHREPDRIPFDLGAAAVTGININALRAFKKYVGLTSETSLRDLVTQLAWTDTDTAERLKVDVRPVLPNPPSHPGPATDLGQVGRYYRLIDEFGIGWQMPVEGGLYYDLYLSPLASAQTVRDVETYPYWPDPLDSIRFAGMNEAAECIVKHEKKACFLERMHSGMWEHAMWMRGYQQFYADMILNPAIVHAIMSRELEIKQKYWEKALETVGANVLVVSCADDLGGQNGLLVSLKMYKELIWPYHKQLFELIKRKAKTKVYIFFHNDGAVYPTIPLLIEAGVDILNPWQVSARGMDDTARFKREYGKDLTIWGGSCDTQRTLPFGTPQEVRDETRRRIEDLAPGGGFVFAPIHVIQQGVPPENILAWWETLQEYGACSATRQG